MTRLTSLSVIGVLLALASPAMGQSGCGGQYAANQFCGTGGSQGLPGPRLIPAGGTTPIGGGTVLGNPTALSALPVATVAPVLGIPGTSVGSIGFANVTSGTVTLLPTTGALVSSVITLPAITDTMAGFALANGGTNNALTASNGGILWSDASKLNILSGTATARQMLQSGANATPAWSTATWPATTVAGGLLTSATANTITASITPVLGVPNVSQGTLGFSGITSGTATITAQATAGTPTITLPSTTGTLADGASLPLVLSATTGNLTNQTTTVLSWVLPAASGGTVWSVVNPDGTSVSTGSTTTQGMQEAVNASLTGSGTAAGDLAINGGDASTGGARVAQLSTTLNFPATQGKRVEIGSITLNSNSGVVATPGLNFDSQELMEFYLKGGQHVYQGTSAGTAIRFKPNAGTPLDGLHTVGDSSFWFTASSAIAFDWTGNSGTGTGATNNYFDFGELNYSNAQNGTAAGGNFFVPSVASGQNFGYNMFRSRHVHGVVGTGTMWKVGNGAPAGGQTFGSNIYQLNLNADSSTSANGIDTYESNSFYLANISGITGGTPIKLESGANKNIIINPTNSAYANNVDNGTANFIWGNGILQGGTGSQFLSLTAGGGINSGFYVNSNQPSYAWRSSGAGVDQKVWDAVANPSGSNQNVLQFRTVNDANSSAVPWLTITRGTGTAISQVQFPTIGDSTSTAHSVALGQATAAFTYAANATAGSLLYASGASTDPAFAQCLPNIQSFTSGSSATYTTPTCTINGQSVRAIQLGIELWGGGAGGGGGGTGGGNGGAGNTTSISTFTATGGAINAGAGGTCTGSPTVLSLAGGTGGASIAVGVNTIGGANGTTPHYGASAFGTLNGVGATASANSGSGGAGGGSSATTAGGAGGSSGAFCRTIVSSPASTYTYTVGAAASGGTAGTSGNNGGGGAAGGIIVTAQWQ